MIYNSSRYNSFCFEKIKNRYEMIGYDDKIKSNAKEKKSYKPYLLSGTPLLKYK